MLTAPGLAPCHQDLSLSLFCRALPQVPMLAHQHWPSPHTQGTHPGHTSPSHLVCSICHVAPCPPHHQPSHSQHTLQQPRSLPQQTEQSASPPLPQLPVLPPPTSTPADIDLKKVTFEAKIRLGAGCWEEWAFSVHAAQTLQQAALSQLGSLLSPRQTWLPS